MLKESATQYKRMEFPTDGLVGVALRLSSCKCWDRQVRHAQDCLFMFVDQSKGLELWRKFAYFATLGLHTKEKNRLCKLENRTSCKPVCEETHEARMPQMHLRGNMTYTDQLEVYWKQEKDKEVPLKSNILNRTAKLEALRHALARYQAHPMYGSIPL
ncbi:hypothetical protein BD414DRAFT_511060 [Trametes punicea]|nr:hypothetical protein BD414DRAFT_511139 [Trametes punicea]KAI8968751.1 hypothetical protein BD414DRAFT_511060 [Trametes punicea]